MSENDSVHMRTVGAVPAYLDVHNYSLIWGAMRVWEGDGWQAESMSWKETAYVAANLIGPIEVVISGPDAQAFLSKISINDVYNWPIGRSKHLVMLSEDGLIANHALTVRDSENRSEPSPVHRGRSSSSRKFDFDVQVELNEIFILQVAGPRSLQILERVLGKDIRDLGFLDSFPRYSGRRRHRWSWSCPASAWREHSHTRFAALWRPALPCTTPSTRPASRWASSASAGGPTP